MKGRKMKLATLALALLLGSVLGVSAVQAHVAPPPGGMESHVDLDALPATLAAAVAAGYFAASPCVPGMGIHAVKLGATGLEQPMLLYNSGGSLIGIEFVTREYTYPNEASKVGYLKGAYGIDLNNPSTWPVAVPPWSGPMGPHAPPPAPQTSIHFDVHIYLTGAGAATACPPPP